MTTTAPPPQPWLHTAIARNEADYQRSADTHLIPLPLPGFERAGIDLYLKDESTHPTGSLKHRLARSLFLYALCNGWVREGSIYGGRCHFVDGAAQVYDAARQVAQDTGGHYMDQFTYAERATDWRGNNNIAESMFAQMRRERHPVPRWIVVGAGTGGTSATIGRYVRFQQYASSLCVADPQGSVFAAYHRSGDASLTAAGSRIEGIGRPRVEPSFIRTLVDRMEEVADAESLAAMRLLSELLGRRVGPSTGTNFVAMLRLAHEMRACGEQGSILSLLCDAGERYLPTYHDAGWVARTVGDCSAARGELQALLDPAP